MRMFPDRTPTAAPRDGHLDIVTIAQLREMRNRVKAEAAIRGRCMVVNVDPRTAVCRVLGRYKMYVDLRDRGFTPHLMFEGYWEYWLTSFIWRNVKPGQVALDLGANHGYYAILFADLVGAAGRVHAFEPNPRMVELLRDNVAVNGFWHAIAVHAAAAGDQDTADQPLLVPVYDPKNARMIPAGHANPDALDDRHELHRVPMVTLDSAVAGPAHFVKIDIEGGEDAAWRGMQGLIARSPEIGILMEFNPHRASDPRGFLELMARRFPLLEVTFDGVAVSVTIEAILGRSEDTILYLSDRAPE